MRRGRVWLILIIFIASFLIWGHIKPGIAKEGIKAITKPERRFTQQLSKKLDVVLANQERILLELENLKKEMKEKIKQ